jgi:hypothetical protein
MGRFSVGEIVIIVLMPSDSTPAVEATWRDFSERRGLDLTEVLQSEFMVTKHSERLTSNSNPWGAYD